MFGNRIRQTLRQTLRHTIGGGSTGSFGGFILFWGQSNCEGQSTNEAAGSAHSGADSGLGFATPFSACRFNQNSNSAPANPLTFSINTGTIDLQTYAAPGQNNVGPEQSLGRALVRYGICKNPIIAKCAVGSTSLPANWAPSSGYPASGEKLYAHLRDYALARKAEFGKPFDLIIDMIGDSDSGTPSRVLSAVADRTAFYAQLRADLGQPGLPVLVSLTNGNLQSPFDPPGMQAQIMAWAAQDGHAYIIDPSRVPLDATPHYLMGGYGTVGELMALRIRDIFRPTLSISLQSGPAPVYQGGDALCTAQASPSVATPRGYTAPEIGDIEVLAAHSSTAAPNVTLTDAQGFTQLVQVDAVSGGTFHRNLTIWTRTVDQSLLNARVADADGERRGACNTPTVDFGSSTLNAATIHCVRGSSGIAAFTTGTAASGTSVVVPSNGGGAISAARDNSLLMILTASNNVATQVSSIANAALSNIAVQRLSSCNPNSGTINTMMATATAAAGAIGNTTVTFNASSTTPAVAIVFNPK